jgi:hypothetical protein
MSKSILLMLCVLIGLLVIACGREGTNKNVAAPAAASSPVPAATASTNANATAKAEKVGVAECDNFITAYETCVSSKVPAAAQANLRSAVTTWRTEWKKLADNPQTRGTLAAACKTQRNATMASMKAYNCAW